MELTDQMEAEIDSIAEHTNEMYPIASFIGRELDEGRLTLNSKKYIAENTKKLSSYKVRLENLLCKTDLKERGH